MTRIVSVVAWFTYGPDGTPLGLFGTGLIEGSRIRADLLVMDRGIFPAAGAEVRFSLDAAPGQWDVLFSDYPVFQDDQIEKVFEWTALPEPLSDRRGLKVGGTNRSDDLAMQMETMIGGLDPLTDYEVLQELTFATNVPSDCVGVGGSPGGSVYLHLGAASVEPRSTYYVTDWVVRLRHSSIENH